jgi:CPA2 family monovalent cation:H+ antiporter-2
VRWLAVDAVVVASIVISASLAMDTLAAQAQERLKLSAQAAIWAVVAAAMLVSSPFWFGMIRSARLLGLELADRTFPRAAGGQLDVADAPRRLLVVTLQLAIVTLVGFPLVAITQPFLPPWQGAAILLLLLVALAISFWNRATNFQGHARAAAQAIAEALMQQTRDGRAGSVEPATNPHFEMLNPMLTGLEPPVPYELLPNSPAVGRTLAELRLRGLTGATVLAIRRGNEPVSVPSGTERLLAGDVLALAGPHESVEAAKEILSGAQHSTTVASEG